MNLLLDTHVLIWWLEKSPKIGKRTVEVLCSDETHVVISAATIWEISIKVPLGKLTMSEPMEAWVPRLKGEWGVHELPITFEHARTVRSLPPHHNDLFDRMLVAQAQCENLTVLTADAALKAYDVRLMNAED